MIQPTEGTTTETNIELVAQAGALIRSGFADRDNNPFADDFVFHFFNSHLPDLSGDYHGFEGMADLFQRLGQLSDTGFHNEPHSLTPYGDELLVAFATNTLGIDGAVIDVDAVVVWRVYGGQIHEAWDIPAINTVRPMTPLEPDQATNEGEQPMTSDDQRQAAIERLNAKREFRLHLTVYVVVNTMLIVIWAATGAGYFWPVWPIGGWGIGLALHAFTVYGPKPITEDAIQAEMRHQGPHDAPLG